MFIVKREFWYVDEVHGEDAFATEQKEFATFAEASAWMKEKVQEKREQFGHYDKYKLQRS